MDPDPQHWSPFNFFVLPSVFVTSFVLSSLFPPVILHLLLFTLFDLLSLFLITNALLMLAGADVSALRLRFHPKPRGAGGEDRSYRQGRVLIRL